MHSWAAYLFGGPQGSGPMEPTLSTLQPEAGCSEGEKCVKHEDNFGFFRCCQGAVI